MFRDDAWIRAMLTSVDAVEREAGAVALYRKYGQLLVRVGTGRGIDEDRAADVAHDVYVRFLALIADGQPFPQSLAGYLVRATRNRADNVRRGDGRREQREISWTRETLSPGMPQEGDERADEVVAVRRMRLLQEALPSLSDKDQQVVMVVLRSSERLSSEKEVADAEGVPYGAFRKRKERLFARLRGIVGSGEDVARLGEGGA